MGQFRFSMYTKWQLGLYVEVNDYCITIGLPFIDMYIATTKHAKGVSLFEIIEW